MLETLGPVLQWVGCHHLLRGVNGLTSLVGRDPLSDMSHLVVILSIELLFIGSVTRDGGRA